MGNLIGGAASDFLIGADGVNTWSLSGPGSGAVTGVGFSSFENLSGGAVADLFQFSAAASFSVINGAAGTDTADYSLLAGPLSLTAGDLSSLFGSASFVSIESIIGSGSTLDLVTGLNAASTWDVTGLNAFTVAGINYSGFENITGGSAADTFNFQSLGALSGSLNGGTGATNLLSYSSRTTVVSVNLQTGAATSIAGGFSNIGDFVGGSNVADSLTGANVVQSWTIDGINSGSIGGAVTFGSFEVLIGGSDNDSFAIADGGSIVSIAGGGGTTNALDYGGRMGAVSVNFGTGVATGVSGFSGINTLVGNANTSLILNAGDDTVQITGVGAGNVNSGQLLYSSVQSLDGAGGSNTLIGRNTANVFAVTGANSGTVDGLSFSNFGSLTGNAAADQFQLQAGGSLSGSINGSSGANSLTYAGRVTAVSVNLQTGSATSMAGGFSNIGDFVGGSNVADSLTGANVVQTWTINGINSGSIGGAVTFGSFEVLIGGTDNDSFSIADGGSIVSIVGGEEQRMPWITGAAWER
ncbi:MAG: hypothetical protein HC904_12485 [Blastochloris sp.]|nr:hypothetical protein [Blastochloris sp.]